MRLNSVDLDIKKFGREIELFLSTTDKNYWKKLIEKIDATTEGKFYKNYLLRRNPLIEGLKQYFHLCDMGKSIWQNRSAEIDFLAKSTFKVNRIINNVNDKAKNQIKGRLKSDDIRPLLFELTIATHFLSSNFEVEFTDYERPSSEGKIFDFFIIKNSFVGEIECKYKSYDAGRKIRSDCFYILCDEFLKQLALRKVKFLIEINCSKNLGKDRSTFIGIVEKTKSAIERREKKVVFSENFSIDINYLPQELIINSDEQFKSVIEPYRTPKSHFATVSNKEMVMIIKIESEKKDRVLEDMYDELKSSLVQFSGDRPALIACCIEGIYPEEWEDLKDKSGLSEMTTRLLNKENAKHVHTVAYSSQGIEISIDGNIIDHKYPVLFFKNPNGLYYKGQDIFSLKDLQA